MSKKIVPFLIAGVFGLLAFFIWRRNKGGGATTGLSNYSPVAPPPVLGGFTGTAAVTGSTVDSSSGLRGFTSSVASTIAALTNVSGGFSGTAAKTVPLPPIPPSTGPSFTARAGRGQF